MSLRETHETIGGFFATKLTEGDVLYRSVKKSVTNLILQCTVQCASSRFPLQRYRSVERSVFYCFVSTHAEQLYGHNNRYTTLRYHRVEMEDGSLRW